MQTLYARLGTTIPVEILMRRHDEHPDSISHAPLLTHEHFIVPSLVSILLVLVAEQTRCHRLTHPCFISPHPSAAMRCTSRHDRAVYIADKSWLLSGIQKDFYRAPFTNDGGHDGFVLNRPAASATMDDVSEFSLLLRNIFLEVRLPIELTHRRRQFALTACVQCC